MTADLESSSAENADRARRNDARPGRDWDIDRDVMQGRTLDFSRRFLPDGLSLLDRLAFLRPDEALRLSQLQGRTYAGTFALLERVIGATVLLRARVRALDDRTAVDNLVRFANDEIKHRELFRKLEVLMSGGMPSGYVALANPSRVGSEMLDRSAWSLLAFACQMELVAQAQYEQAFEPRDDLCPLFKDVFRYHAHDERQHALLDECEWTAVHRTLAETARDQAVDDFIALSSTLDGVLRAQAQADTHYFLKVVGRRFTPIEASQLESTMLAAARWQFIVSGMQHVHFRRLLTSVTTAAQSARITAALRPVLQA